MAFAAAFVLGSGCTLTPAAPTIDSVSPTWGYNGESTEIEIAGAHFFPTVIVADAVGSKEEDDGRIEGTFQAWLVGADTYALEGVQHLAYDRIAAEVPEGLPIGTYDLRVEVPSGLVTTATDLFTVTDTRADHLEIDTDGFVFIVGEQAALTVRVEDPEEQGVQQPLVVQIVAKLPEGSTTEVTFDPDGLIDQEFINDGVGVRGRLSSTGIGKVKVTTNAADTIEFEVDAVDSTTVRGDETTISWTAGDVASVEVILPSEEFEAVAGEPFDVTVRFRDALGNVIPSEGTFVTLSDSCGTWFKVNTEVGTDDTVPVTLEKVCAANEIIVSAFEKHFFSEVFAVVPAAHDGYTVQPYGIEVDAGEELTIEVEAVDEFDNVITDHDAILTLYDDLGGLDPWGGRGEQSCLGFVAGRNLCHVRLWTAGPEVTIRVVDTAVKRGEAAPIEVLPDVAASLLVLIDEASVEAGETFHVSVRALDRFLNSVGFDPGGDNPVSWTDESGSIECVWTGAEEGAQGFDCVVTGAVPDAKVAAHVLELTDTTGDPLVVTNAGLADVDVDPLGSSFVAGTPFTVELRGFDTYGNPYIVQADPEVDLTDSAATMVPGTAVLGPAGIVQVSAVVYRAGSGVRLYASQGGAGLGVSRALVVSPDVMERFDVQAPAWISVDEPGTVEVTAVDTYDNPITSYAGTVTLSSVGQACDPVEVSAFSAGTATVDITCDEPRLSEELLAADADFEGTSDVDIVDLACANGPTAALELDGDDDSIRCLADGGSVDVEAESSASVAGASSIAVRHFTDGETSSVRTPGDATTFTYETTGTRSIEVLVADSHACADIVSGEVYVGSNDGEPTGPVSVSASTSTAFVGGALTITVSARDCTEDLAAGQQLLVRADLGTTTGTSTGAGRVITLDGAGSASLTWSFLDSDYAGTATVYAGSAGGGAIGQKSVTVTGDAVNPTVAEVTPTGKELGTISTIEVTFSEAMDTDRFTNAYLPLTGPSGSAVAADYHASADERTVVITPVTPLSGAAGTYTLSLSQYLRDLAAGNPLDGGWSGVRAPVSFTFGNVPVSVPEISSCTPSVASFTPDGDDGAGTEADTVTVTPTATGTPTWWWLQVYDAGGTRVRSLRAVGTEALVTWDGRGDDGIVRVAGRYRLALAPIDSSDNVGGQCDVTVDLEQHVDGP